MHKLFSYWDKLREEAYPVVSSRFRRCMEQASRLKFLSTSAPGGSKLK
jgi:hypothetical protein